MLRPSVHSVSRLLEGRLSPGAGHRVIVAAALLSALLAMVSSCGMPSRAPAAPAPRTPPGTMSYHAPPASPVQGRVPASMSPAAAARLEQRVDSVLSLMTLEEKAGQLSITGGRPDLDSLVRAGRLGGTNGVLPGKDVLAVTRHFQQVALQSRLKIPLLFMGDVIHGFRTVYPVPLALAATWDTTLVTSVDSASAAEATASGVDWTFSPMLDIGRDPRWGRVVEGPGEDPYLGSALARAQVRGYQGNVTGSDLASPTTMAATAKHFAGYGAVMAGRDYNSVDLSDRTLRSVYLPTFHAAVNAGVATIMAAFTALDGVPSTANVWLLKGILRDEWGFQGVVVSDYDAVPELENHRIAATDADAVALAMRAGVDVDLHSLTYTEQLPGLVRSGRVSEAAVDSAVRRVLRLKFRLGLFDDPFRYDDPARAKAVTLSPSQRALARRAAAESFVLLENHGVLPLSSNLKSIAVLGPLADDSANPLGPVHAVGRSADTRTVLAGIRARLGAGVRVLYARGTGIGDLSPAGAAGTDNAAHSGTPDTAGVARAAALAKRADAAVVVVGEAASMSGEGGSRSRLDLPGAQLSLVKAVVATGTPTVVVLMSGRPLTIPWLAEHAPALLETWFPGTEAGSAIADVLFGDAEPGGRLPISFPRDVGQIPIFYAHRPTGRPAVASDRYTSKYLDVANSPLYPFGYGLGYTRFEYSDVRVDRTRMAFGDTVHVSVTVRNVGQRAGTDVVQLYVTDEEASVSPVVERLRGFRRVRLAAGEAREVSFPLTAHDLALYSVDMKRYAAEPGFFTVSVGGNSRDAREHQARFELVAR